MKQNWIYKKLKDICGIQYGYPFDSHCFTEDSSFPALIRIRDVVRGFSETYYKGSIPDEYYVKAGEYLIGMDGEFNIAPWRSEKALLNQRVCKIFSTDSETEVRFVYYSLIKILKQIEDETPSVTVKHLSAKRLNQKELPIPSLDEQQAIVRELDGINRLIDLQEEQLREYDRLAQSLFYTTFGDPVSNPKGWEVKKLGEVAETTSGGTPSKAHNEYYEGGTIPWLRSGEVSQGLIFKTELFITQAGLDNSSAKIIPVNSVAIAMYGATVGEVGIIKAPMSTNQAVCSIFPNESVMPIYLLYFLRAMKPHYINIAAGGAQPNISQAIIRNTKLPLPPLALQQSFAAQIEAIEQQKALIRRSLDETRTLLAARMQYYFE